MDFTNLINIETDAPVLYIAGAIMLISVLLYSRWAHRIRSAKAAVKKLSDNLQSTSLNGRDLIGEIDASVDHPTVRRLLAETSEGLVDLPADLGPRSYSLRSYSDIWTVRGLLTGRLNLSLFEAMPNLLIGVGLMFTFIFLTLALVQARTLIGAHVGTQDLSGVDQLLATAGGKFITSIAGLLCSLVWNWQSKALIDSVDMELDRVRSALRAKIPDAGTEALVTVQLSLLNAVLEENREQVGQLRRFETDFAVAIAKAMDNALQPAFQKMTDELRSAINALTERVGSMNEDALRTMLSDFSSNLKEMSGEEMTAFKGALIKLSESLDNAGRELVSSLGVAGTEAAGKLQTAGQAFADNFALASQTFKESATLLEQAMVSAKATVNDLDATLDAAKEAGGEGVVALRSVLGTLESGVAGLEESLSNIAGAAELLSGAAEKLGVIAVSLDKNVESQDSVLERFRAAAPEFRDAMTAAIRSVAESGEAAKRSLSQVEDSMQKTVDKLDSSVSEMREGVGDYTNQVVELHAHLEKNLALALQKLGGAISSLDETLSEFAEELEGARAR